MKPALAVALALLCALASAPTAQAAFGSPFDVSAAGGATLQQVALDAQGGAHFVWKRSSVSGEPPGALIETRMRASDGTLGAPQRLSREMENPGHELLRPRVAIGGGDRAHFAWSQEFGDAFLVQARVRAPDGALGPVQDISEPGHFAGFPELAVDAAGRTTFVWIGVDPADPNRELVVKSRRRAADGALGPIQAVSGTGTSPSNAPDNVHVAVDPAGNAHLAWEQGEVIETARRSADGVLGPVRDVSVAEPGQVAGFPRVAVAPDGDVDFVWSGGLIRTRRLAADGTFGPVRGVSAPSADGSEHADVAVDPDGNAHIVWEDPVSPPPSQMIRTRRVAADGTLGPIQDLSATSSGEVSGPSLAVDGAGNAHFAWERRVGASDLLAETRRRAAGGALGPVQVLSTRGFAPVIAANAAGDAAAAWVEDRPTDPRFVLEGAFSQGGASVAIVGGPSGVVGQPSARFEFAVVGGSAPPGRFECRLDSAEEAAFVPCVSPRDLTGLSDGEHVFEVRYHPDGEDPGDAAERRWTVDTTAPVVSFTSAPSGGGQPPDVTIGFAADEEGVGFECSLDGAPVFDCTSPVELRGLAVGLHAFAVQATDRAGNVSDIARTEWEVVLPPPPPPDTGFECPGGRTKRVAFGVIVAIARSPAACFAPESVDGATALVSRGLVSVNGIRLAPGSGGRIVVDPALVGGTVRAIGPVSIAPGDLPLEGWTLDEGFSFGGLAQGGVTALNRVLEDVENRLKLARLPIRGGAGLEFSADNGGQTRITTRLVLPNATFQALPGLSPEGTGLTVEVPITVSNDRGLTGGIRLKLDEARLFGKVKVKDLDLFYDHLTQTFEGGAALEFVSGAAATPGGGLARRKFAIGLAIGPEGLIGPLRKLSLKASSLNRPLGYGVFVQRLNAELRRASAPGGGELARLAGGGGLSLGPEVRIGSREFEALSLDATVTLDIPTGPVPPEPFSVTGAGAMKVIDFPFADASVRYVPPARLEVAGTMDATVFGYGMAAELTRDDAGRPLSWASPDGFNIEARGQARMPLLGGTDPLDAVFSDGGWAACIGPPGERVGFGRRWFEPLDAMHDACDLGPYRSTATAAQAGGTRTVRIRRGTRVIVLSARGRGAPPKVDFSGPAGAPIATPDSPRGVRVGASFLFQEDRTDTTHLVLRRPAAGRWTVTARPGSPAVASVRVASALPPVRLRARVRGRGRNRTLTWRAGPLPFGQRLTFVERGAQTAEVLRTTSRRRGRLRFAPSTAPGRARRIEVLVSRRGMPRLTRTVARFTAPRPPRVTRVRSLRVRGRMLRWRRQDAAATYALAITAPDGARTSHSTTRARLRLPFRARRGRVSVTIVALTAHDRVGPAVTRRFTLRRARRSR